MTKAQWKTVALLLADQALCMELGEPHVPCFSEDVLGCDICDPSSVQRCKECLVRAAKRDVKKCPMGGQHPSAS